MDNVCHRGCWTMSNDMSYSVSVDHFCIDINMFKEERKKNQTISAIILVHSPGMLYDKRIIMKTCAETYIFPPFMAILTSTDLLLLGYFFSFPCCHPSHSPPICSPPRGRDRWPSGK